jgi:hypothetical protein
MGKTHLAVALGSRRLKGGSVPLSGQLKSVDHFSKLMTAVKILNDRMLPFYEEQGVELEHMLTNNGREYCGRPLSHFYDSTPSPRRRRSPTRTRPEGRFAPGDGPCHS